MFASTSLSKLINYKFWIDMFASTSLSKLINYKLWRHKRDERPEASGSKYAILLRASHTLPLATLKLWWEKVAIYCASH